MASRWAYEGLAVTQYMANDYERVFYAFDQRMKTANWKKDLWVRELQERSADVRRALGDPAKMDARAYDLSLIRNEIGKEVRSLRGFTFPAIGKLDPAQVDATTLDALDASLNTLTSHYRNAYREAERAKEERIASMTSTPASRLLYFDLLDRHRNESLADFVTNKNDVNVIVDADGELVQKSDPIYVEPREGGFFAAHFYAPVKRVFGQAIPTLWANILLLWGMTVLLALALQANLFPKLIQRLSTHPWNKTQA